MMTFTRRRLVGLATAIAGAALAASCGALDKVGSVLSGYGNPYGGPYHPHPYHPYGPSPYHPHPYHPYGPSPYHPHPYHPYGPYGFGGDWDWDGEEDASLGRDGDGLAMAVFESLTNGI